ncbi:hypothetical protein GCM10009804_62310 [Kribbella hippodromi]|uniref:Uncharacterized protein n=1 Tax=Kribbella hippodromi TaxID=434347 RepID=A0ABN2E5X3_9ACTN
MAHAALGDRVEEDDDDDVLKVAAGIALGVLMTVGAYKAAPQVKAWWKERRAKKGTAPDTSETSEASEPTDLARSAELAGLAELAGVAGLYDGADTPEKAALGVGAFAAGVEVALEAQRTEMSSAEAQRRLLEVMVAAAVIAGNMRALGTAELEHGASPELRSAMDKLTVPQVTDSLNRMLAADSSLLGEQASADLMQIFGGGGVIDGRYVPLRDDLIQEALRLPRTA